MHTLEKNSATLPILAILNPVGEMTQKSAQ